MNKGLAQTSTLRKGEESEKNFAVILRGIYISLSMIPLEKKCALGKSKPYLADQEQV